MDDYRSFIRSKKRFAEPVGFDVSDSDINQRLHDWQRIVTRFSLKSGRTALFEDCGLGKTPQQLEWGRLVSEYTDKPVLILAPLAVGSQTVREAEKFNIDCPVRVVSSQLQVGRGINIANYEKLHHFSTHVFGGIVLEESQILKSFTGKTKQQLCREFAKTQFKLCCSATPAPNDRMELGNHSEFLSILPSSEMLQRFFINDTMKAGGYRLRKHAQNDYWDWMTSWSVCISKPSDIGFSDDGYILPPLNVHEHIVYSDKVDEGFLFNLGKAISATKVHQEKRRCLNERAEVVAGLVNNSTDAWAVWCDTDYEADALRKVIPDAIEVRGSHSERVKEERLSGFSSGRHRVIITKPEIGGLGLNWQHCHKTTWFAGYSFEKFYQAIRRMYRFGQTHAVDCHVVASESEQSILEAVNRKQSQHGEMFSEMARSMRGGMLERVCGRNRLTEYEPSATAELPGWLTTKS